MGKLQTLQTRNPKLEPTQLEQARLELVLLGAPLVRVGGQPVRFRTRKTLALLAYLVLEPGLHARDKLLALLWPEAENGAGRALLRSTMAYLNRNLGGGHRWLLAQRDAVGLDTQHVLNLDVWQLEAAFKRAAQPVDPPEDFEVQLEAARFHRGKLLEGLSFSDAPAFDDWLLAQREVVCGWQEGVLKRLCELQLQSGRLDAALETAQRRIQLELLSEAAHRMVIGLHLRMGNRSAALEAYRVCVDILAAELGLEPEAETQVLIEGLRSHPQKVEPSRPAPFLEVLERPRYLTGRAREWAALEMAWDAGRTIMVSGESGVGKSRLIEDFAASHGRFVLFEGRPGDVGAPFSSLARLLRNLMPDAPSLEPWVRRELSRLVPELEAQPPEPWRSDDERLRFFEAVRVFVSAVDRICLVADDVQFMDAGSAQWLAFWTANLPEGFSTVIAFRRDELPADVKSSLQNVLDSEQTARIHLECLDQFGLHDLLCSLDVPGLDSLSAVLHRFTGGNPFFALETMRALQQRGGLNTITPEQFEGRRRATNLPRSPRAQDVIQRRLERLSPQARDLARVAAVSGAYFSLELGSSVLEASPLELSRASEELEATQVWRGLRFCHDLLLETTLENIPESVSVVLHERILEALEARKAPPRTNYLAWYALEAALADHAIAARRWAKAFAHSVEAAAWADFDLAALRLEHAEYAWQLLLHPPEGFDPVAETTSEQRMEVYGCLRAALQALSRYDRDDGLAAEFREYARRIGDARLELRTLMPFGNEQRLGNDLERRMLYEALEIAERLNDPREWLAVQIALMHHEFINSEYVAALERADGLMPVARSMLTEADRQNPNIISHPMFDALRMVGQANLWSGHWDEALVAQREVEALLRPFPQHHPWSTANCQLWLSVMLLNLGRLEESLSLGRTACKTFCELTPNDPYSSSVSSWYAMALWDHGDLTGGMEVSHRVMAVLDSPNIDVFYRSAIYWYRAHGLLLLGQLEAALPLALESLRQNEEQVKRNAWGQMMQEFYANAVCSIHALRQDWDKAFEYAMLAAQCRFSIGNEAAAHTPRMRRDLEIEALLRGGAVDLARESVRRLGEATRHYARRQIPYLRGLAALEVWDGNLESAIGHLEDARGLMIPIGLPHERWTLEAKLAQLYGQRGDLKKARQARATALEVVNALSQTVLDTPSRTVFLQFAHDQIGVAGQKPA